jgi:hypothetical protein
MCVGFCLLFQKLPGEFLFEAFSLSQQERKSDARNEHKKSRSGLPGTAW